MKKVVVVIPVYKSTPEELEALGTSYNSLKSPREEDCASPCREIIDKKKMPDKTRLMKELKDIM